LIPVSRPLISESDRSAVIEALDQTWISGETEPVQRLESKLSEILGVQHTVAISNGTAALDLAIEALGVQRGDDCIVPTFTIISTVSQLLRIGANVLLADSDPISWSVDVEKMESLVTKKTKLIIPVHIYGLAADMNAINEVTKDSNAFILEDAAEALGVTFDERQCGSLGDASIFSFYANKVVTGGEGGAFCTNDADLAHRVRALRNLNFLPGKRFVSAELGYNQRLGGLSAALIHSQLMRLDQLNSRKIELAKRYLQNLEGHPWISFAPLSYKGTTNTFWVFPILLNESSPFDAEKLQEKLHQNGVQTRRFFCPMHLQPLAEQYGMKRNSDFPIADNLWKKGIYLPSGLGITEDEIDRVSDILWSLTK
jgi:perosamine synthetase